MATPDFEAILREADETWVSTGEVSRRAWQARAVAEAWERELAVWKDLGEKEHALASQFAKAHDAAESRVTALTEALEGTVNHWIDTEHGLAPCWCPTEPPNDDRVIPHAACLDARAALAAPPEGAPDA